MIWALISFAAAILWAGMAVGFIPYDARLVPFAFVLLAINCVIGGVKDLIDR